jgi:hypothetical protein
MGILDPGNRTPPDTLNGFAVIDLLKGFDTRNIPVLPNSPATPVTPNVGYEILMNPSEQRTLANTYSLGNISCSMHFKNP